MLRDYGRSPVFSPGHSSLRRGLEQNQFAQDTATAENPDITKFYENNTQVEDPAKLIDFNKKRNSGFAKKVE